MNGCPSEDIHQHFLKPVCACLARSETEAGVRFKCSLDKIVFQSILIVFMCIENALPGIF